MADKLSTYDKGFRDGYHTGLDECGPISGLTGFFKRRGKLKKLSKMKEGERVAVITEAIAEHEAEEKQAKQTFANPAGSPTRKTYLVKSVRFYMNSADRYPSGPGVDVLRRQALNYAGEQLDLYKAEFGADATYNKLEDRWAKKMARTLNPKAKKKPKRKTKTNTKRGSSPSVRMLVRKALQ